MKKITTPILILLAVLLVSGVAWGQVAVTKAAIPPGTTRADGSAHQNNDTLVWLTAYNRWVAAAGGAGAGTWGSITGTITGQTDLITLLGGASIPSPTEFAYVKGLTSAVQTQLNNLAPKYVTYTATATAKDVVYMTAAGTAARAKADAVGTVYAIGFATETKTAAACIIQTAGVITVTGKTFTPGLPVYISPTTAGDCTQTPPATVGHQAQVIGIALTATAVEIVLGPVVEVGSGIETPAGGGTGVANGTNNTLTFTGNYTLGLTLTGNTGVTLPTSGTLPTLAGTETLTNKRVNPRVKVLPYNDATQTFGETTDYNTDIADMFICGTPASSHGIAAGMDFGAPGGTPVEGQKLTVRLYFATAQTITWNAVFVSRGGTLPGAASGGTAKYVTIGFVYNALASTWDCVAVATEA